MGSRGEANAIAIADAAGNAKLDWPIKTLGLHAENCKFANILRSLLQAAQLGRPCPWGSSVPQESVK